MTRSSALRALVVLGTRPEAIKLAPVIRALGDRREVELRVCSTGQHRELLSPVIDLFQIRVDHALDVMRADPDMAALTSRLLEGLSGVIEADDPDVVIVQGDTTSCFAGSLAAFYRGVPVAHVEAGLRTRRRRSPFPEEVNRRFTGLLADLHFAPTETAARNLIEDQVPHDRVFVTGNTVIDAMVQVAAAQSDPAERGRLETWARDELGLDPARRWILMTGHRRESFGAAMAETFRGVRRLVDAFPDVEVVHPVHLNPRVRAAVDDTLRGRDRIHLVEPVAYDELVYLLARAELVVTDSGGIQEEAPTFGKPVLVTRDTTERPEGIEAGVARLVGTDADRIFDEASRLLGDRAAYLEMASVANPYGDGKAAERIVETLVASGLAPLATPR